MRTTGIDRFVSHSNGRMVLMLLCHVISSMSLCSVLCANVDKRDKTYLYRLFNTQSHYYETLLNIYCLLWVLLLACLNQKAIIPRVHSRQGRVPQCIDRNLFDRRRKFQRIYIYICERKALYEIKTMAANCSDGEDEINQRCPNVNGSDLRCRKDRLVVRCVMLMSFIQPFVDTATRKGCLGQSACLPGLPTSIHCLSMFSGLRNWVNKTNAV